MHRSLRHMALLLIIFYLFIPVMGLAHSGGPDIGASNLSSIGSEIGSPCDHCPCSDEQGACHCDASCCSCASHSPPVQGVQIRYAPVIIITRHMESFMLLPQVYFTIFVPPQNPFAGSFSVVAEHTDRFMPLDSCAIAAT